MDINLGETLFNPIKFLNPPPQFSDFVRVSHDFFLSYSLLYFLHTCLRNTVGSVKAKSRHSCCHQKGIYQSFWMENMLNLRSSWVNSLFTFVCFLLPLVLSGSQWVPMVLKYEEVKCTLASSLYWASCAEYSLSMCWGPGLSKFLTAPAWTSLFICLALPFHTWILHLPLLRIPTNFRSVYLNPSHLSQALSDPLYFGKTFGTTSTQGDFFPSPNACPHSVSISHITFI